MLVYLKYFRLPKAIACIFCDSVTLEDGVQHDAAAITHTVQVRWKNLYWKYAKTVHNKLRGKSAPLATLTVPTMCTEQLSAELTVPVQRGKMWPGHLVPKWEMSREVASSTLSLIGNLSLPLVLSLPGGVPVPTLPTRKMHTKPGRWP